LYENGTIAIVEAVSPELGNRVQRVRVQLPGTSAELLTKFREKKIDFAAHSNTEDGGAVFLNLLGELNWSNMVKHGQTCSLPWLCWIFHTQYSCCQRCLSTVHKLCWWLFCHSICSSQTCAHFLLTTPHVPLLLLLRFIIPRQPGLPSAAGGWPVPAVAPQRRRRWHGWPWRQQPSGVRQEQGSLPDGAQHWRDV
jgi:hypothetical protein